MDGTISEAVDDCRASHLSRNPASGQVLQKIGLRHQETRFQTVRPENPPEMVHYLSILSTDPRPVIT